MFKKNSKRTIKHLEINTDVFYQMGGRYIFSALPIENAKQNQLTLENVFHSKESAWTIYLYKVIP
jgi:hypothetical protein